MNVNRIGTEQIWDVWAPPVIVNFDRHVFFVLKHLQVLPVIIFGQSNGYVKSIFRPERDFIVAYQLFSKAPMLFFRLDYESVAGVKDGDHDDSQCAY